MSASTEQGTEAVSAAGAYAGSHTASVLLGAANDANTATWYYKYNECKKKRNTADMPVVVADSAANAADRCSSAVAVPSDAASRGGCVV